MAGVVITLEETLTKDQIKATTNAEGTADFHIVGGTEYAILYKGVKDKRTVRMPPSGNGSGSRSITYVPADERTPDIAVADRSGVEFEVIRQYNTKEKYPANGNSMLQVKIRNRDRKMLSGITVHLTNVASKKRYKNVTDREGKAQFIVPPNVLWEIDVESTNALKKMKSPAVGYAAGITITYEASQIPQQMRNDTIIQNIVAGTKPSTTHALMEVSIYNFDDQPLDGEKLWFDQVNGGQVIEVQTNSEGIARFLLPKGDEYTLHLKYERNLTKYDNTEMAGFAGGELFYRYRGTESIQQFYKETKRDANGFITEFMESETEPTRINYNYLHKTKDGFTIKFDNQSAVSTPAVSDNDLFVSGGAFTREFYSFDKKSGAYNWGLKLADGGASSAVLYDGVVLIMTESCTLYAIDAETGKVLWTKWLGPYLYSTPSVSDGKVIAAYPTELGNQSERGKDFALVCFDLKTGDIDWQQYIDAETLAAPVIANDRVYLTTLAGSFHIVDFKTGKRIVNQNVMATSPPTVVGDVFYIAQQRSTESKSMQVIAKYDASTGKQLARFESVKGQAGTYEDNYKIALTGRMNFNGSRPLWSNGMNYSVMGNEVIAYDPANGRVHWKEGLPIASADMKGNAGSAPIMVNNKLVIATRAGKVLVIEPKSGDVVDTYVVDGELWTQPVVDNGVIYAGTLNGEMICKRTGDSDLDGWNMWGGNASHNLVVGK